MPSFRITGPDGAKYNITAPEGATEQDALNILQTQLASKPAPVAVDKAKAAEMAAEGVGTGEALAIGAGRTFDKVAMGLKQTAIEGVKRIAPKNWSDAAEKDLAELSASEQEKDAAYAALQGKKPIASAIGEALPMVAIPASAGVVGGAALAAGVEGAKYGSAGERAKNAAIGGGATLAGGLLAKGAAGLIAPVTKKAASGTHQAALAAAERIGYQPRLSEVTGSQFIGRMEDAAARIPGGAGVMDDFARANQEAVNRAAARSMGETADDMGSAVFADAKNRLGKVFEDISALTGRPIKVGGNVGSAADEILRMQGKMLPNQQDEVLINLAQQAKALASNKGRIDGETYQLIRSGLSEASFDATGTNKALYGKLLEALDDSADASLRAAGNTALADALRTARPQYANMKTLERGAVAEAGNVSPARVANAMRQKNPGSFRRGEFVGTPLGDVAAVGEGLKPLRAGSQTFERETVTNPIALGIYGPMSWLTAKATTSPLMTLYPRTLGKTATARSLAEVSQPVGRTLAAEEIARLLSLTSAGAPVVAE